MKENSSKDYLLYDLIGFEEIIIKDNYKCEVNNSLIKNIEVNEDFTSLKVELRDDVIYEENSIDIEKFLDEVCFNLIINTEASIYQPLRRLKALKRISSKNVSNIYVREYISPKDTKKLIRSFPAEDIYNKILNNDTGMNNRYVEYQRIFKILHNPNFIIKFMSLYQFLMEIVSEGKTKIEQKNVVNYMKTKESKYDFIKFKETRRINRHFDEDCFTYLRNQIGHAERSNDLNEYTRLSNNIDNRIIRKLLLIINDALMEQQL